MAHPRHGDRLWFRLLLRLLLASLIAVGVVGFTQAVLPQQAAKASAISPDGDPLLLVHGFTDTCAGAFSSQSPTSTIAYLTSHGWSFSALDVIGYYGFDTTSTSCMSNLQDLQAEDPAAWTLCHPLLDWYSSSAVAGSTDDPIQHLGCLLAWHIYDTYGGRPVDILAHSMGGLIVRDAIGESGHNVDYRFPPTPLNVHVVVTVGTPHGGVYGAYTDMAKKLFGTPQELLDMISGSPFMNLLGQSYMLNPQGLFGTHWNLMASSVQCEQYPTGTSAISCLMDAADLDTHTNGEFPDGDGIVQADSALAMPADFKILYGSGLNCLLCVGGGADNTFTSGGLEYSHETNTCMAQQQFSTFSPITDQWYTFTIPQGCLSQPFYLNDGADAYTQAWVCNVNCTSGSPGVGGIADLAGFPSSLGTFRESLWEIVALLGTYGPGAYSPIPAKVALNGSYTFVAIGDILYKYDLGSTGIGILSQNADGTQNTYGTNGPDYIGNQIYSSPITAVALNGQYLFVALGDHRVIKTTLCGSGGNMCALSDSIGSGSLAGYSYWQGFQDFGAPVTGLAATTSYLFTNLAGGGVSRTVKTTLCGTGGDMCALSDTIGSGSLSGYSYWKGFQDWSWNPTAIAANDSIVLTTIGSTRVCKTTLGSTGGNVFALSSGSCTGSYTGYNYWKGYQDWSQSITNLAVDSSHIWWGLGSQSRLVQTTWCGTGGNMCALSDGIGSGSLSGYSYWVGRQDWCSGYNQMGVASNGQYVDALFTTGAVTRVVKATATGGSGGNMFATSDCTGTWSLSGYYHWIGSQDYTVA